MDTCYKKTKQALSGAFTRYGVMVGHHPLPFIILPILIFGGLGAGMILLDEETDLEEMYFPKDSVAKADRQTVRNIFDNMRNSSYNSFSQSDVDQAITVIFRSKHNHAVFQPLAFSEIQSIVDQMKDLVVDIDGRNCTFHDLCARSASKCVVDGDFVLKERFQMGVVKGLITYPLSNLRMYISDVTTGRNGNILLTANLIRVSFKLREKSLPWQKRFQAFMKELKAVHTEVTYETPDSLSDELNQGIQGDILTFSLTITLCCCYASVVAAGGNPVSTRFLLSTAGILSAGLGIVGSMGLLSICGVKFVSIAGVVPFLVIGEELS